MGNAAQGWVLLDPLHLRVIGDDGDLTLFLELQEADREWEPKLDSSISCSLSKLSLAEWRGNWLAGTSKLKKEVLPKPPGA
jgi:hypothetical protein